MVDFVTVGLFVVAGLASLAMAWTIGAGSAGSTPFAPAVGANAIPIMQAAFVVGILIFLGAVIQGANVSEAIGRELILNVELTVVGASVGLTIAAALVLIGVFTGYPIATAFTVTGAVIGVGFALGGAPAWGKYTEIALLWTLTPVTGGGCAYLLARWLQGPKRQEIGLIAILGGVVAALLINIELAVLGSDPGGTSIAVMGATYLPGSQLIGALVISGASFVTGVAITNRSVSRNVDVGERRFALVLGAIVAFSAGGSQVGLAVGPLLPMLDGVVPLIAILAGGGLGLLIGAWTGAPRLIKAVAQDYSSLGPRRSIAALVPSFIIAQIAILLGIPVSFNQIIVSAIVGSGAAVAGGGISRRKIVFTFGAWAGSFALALVAGFGVMRLLGLWP